MLNHVPFLVMIEPGDEKIQRKNFVKQKLDVTFGTKTYILVRAGLISLHANCLKKKNTKIKFTQQHKDG